MSNPKPPTPPTQEPPAEPNNADDPNALEESEQSTANESNGIPNPTPDQVSQVQLPG